MEEIEQKDEFDEPEDDELIMIRVQENTLNDEIIVYIPANCWDLDNLGDAIKKAVIMVTANIPDKLDS